MLYALVFMVCSFHQPCDYYVIDFALTADDCSAAMQSYPDTFCQLD